MSRIEDLQPDRRNVTFIYVLTDPRTGAVRYIGKANDPQSRFRRHIANARDGKSYHAARWIRSLLNVKLRPILSIVETCQVSEWKNRESFWINFYRATGADLTNCNAGGDGLEPTAESRKKMSEAKMGMIPYNKGKSTPREIREKQSVAARHRWKQMTREQRKEYIAKTAGKNPVSRPAGWKHSEEAKTKIAQASAARICKEETREKIRAFQRGKQWNLGKRLSEETKRKIGEANKMRFLERQKWKSDEKNHLPL